MMIEAFARHLHPAEISELAARGQHCDVRRCREPIATYGWYYRFDRHLATKIGHERVLCLGHGEAFAARHRLVLEPAPSLEEVSGAHAPPLVPGRAALMGMSADMIAAHEALGWTCDVPRCHGEARYLSGLNYATQAGPVRHVSRFLCDRHAGTFAVRHGIDMASVRPPEVSR